MWLYICLAVGALGVSIALPRPRVNPQILGVVLGGVALGGLFLSMGLKAGVEQSPGLYFYVFSAIALGSALRVISHARPVYSALYFIMTILSSSALYLLLHAEFMAFALIIIYAGAIVITYLFVIMLAEQAPSDDELGSMADYDRFSREPMIATGVGFVLLGLLTVMLAEGFGNGEMPSQADRGPRASLLELMPKKVLGSLDRIGAMEGLVRPPLDQVATTLDIEGWTIGLAVKNTDVFAQVVMRPDVAKLVGGEEAAAELAATLVGGQMVRLGLPASLREENIDGVGFALIAEHPMALELAGVILLMAMLGAVVLARKQIEIGEAEKAQAALSLEAMPNGQTGGGA